MITRLSMMVVPFLWMLSLEAEVNPIYVNPEGQVGLNVDESEAIPAEVDILLKGRTKSDGIFQLPFLNANPANPENGMMYVHVSGEMRYFANGSWHKLSTEPLPEPLRVESGVVSCGDEFTTVNLTESFVSPVVIATAVSNNSNAPVVVRFDNVGPGSLDVKVQRMDGLSDPISGIVVHFMVFEEGVYNEAEHGVKMEVRRFNSTIVDRNGSWTAQAMGYAQTYAAPVVLGQVMSYENTEFSQFWCKGSGTGDPPTVGILNVGKHSFSVTGTHVNPETLGVVIIESGSGTMNGINYHCGVGADIILGVGNNGDYNYDLPASVSTAVVSQVAMDGGDGGVATFKVDPQGQSVLKILIDEDMIVDTERNHTSEQASYLVFE